MNTTNKSIVITAAHSPLGQRFLKALAAESKYMIYAIVTPWASLAQTDQNQSYVKYIKADLSQPLDSELSRVFSEADAVFHFAWMRGNDFDSILATNESMIRNAIGHMKDPAKFYFMSSVAASPGAMSIYGKTKYAAAEMVRSGGGTVLVLGLVTDDVPMGAYKTLVKLVGSLPVSFRAKGSDVFVYPLSTKSLNQNLIKLIEKPVPAGTYNMFDSRDSLNDFLKSLESSQPRFRVRLNFQAPRTVKITNFLKSKGLFPKRIADKVLTFLTKEDDYLQKFSSLPGQ